MSQTHGPNNVWLGLSIVLLRNNDNNDNNNNNNKNDKLLTHSYSKSYFVFRMLLTVQSIATVFSVFLISTKLCSVVLFVIKTVYQGSFIEVQCDIGAKMGASTYRGNERGIFINKCYAERVFFLLPPMKHFFRV